MPCSQGNLHICRRNPKECRECQFCTEHFYCPGVGEPSIDRFETACVGCGVCYLACPFIAVERIRDTLPRKMVTIIVDGDSFTVPERFTLRRALELIGLEFGRFPGEAKIFAPCETGGCYACALVVDGEPKPACVTPVQEGMTVNLTLAEDYVPLRRASGFMPHPVGGVGTPWQMKKSVHRYVEVACFVHGCNLRCPQCQNYTVRYLKEISSEFSPPSRKHVKAAQEYYEKLKKIFDANIRIIFPPESAEWKTNLLWRERPIRELFATLKGRHRFSDLLLKMRDLEQQAINELGKAVKAEERS